MKKTVSLLVMLFVTACLFAGGKWKASDIFSEKKLDKLLETYNLTKSYEKDNIVLYKNEETSERREPDLPAAPRGGRKTDPAGVAHRRPHEPPHRSAAPLQLVRRRGGGGGARSRVDPADPFGGNHAESRRTPGRPPDFRRRRS